MNTREIRLAKSSLRTLNRSKLLRIATRDRWWQERNTADGLGANPKRLRHLDHKIADAEEQIDALSSEIKRITNLVTDAESAGNTRG